MTATAERECIDCGTVHDECRAFGPHGICPDCAEDYPTRRALRERFKAENRRVATEALPPKDERGFEDYLTPVGEYDQPAYIYFPEVRRRFARRRAQFLEAEYDMAERYALALAARQATCSWDWLLGELDVQRDTVGRYFEDLRGMDRFGDNVVGGNTPPPDPEAPLDTSGTSKHPRTCPSCGEVAAISVTAVNSVYPTVGEELKRAVEAARNKGDTTVCENCHTSWGDPAEQTDDGEVVVKGSYSRIPEAVQELDRWLTRKDKVMAAPWAGAMGGLRGGAMNSNGWTDFATAVDWATKLPGHGLAFAMTTLDDLVVLDLDDVVDAEGNLAEMAREMVEQFDAYTEFSPSGTGLHIVFRGEVPSGVRFTSIEVYDHGSGITFTGDVYHDGPVAERQDALDALIAEWGEEVDPLDGFTPEEFDASSVDSPFYDIPVAALYDEPTGERVDHPVHGSTTGGNFKIFDHGMMATCFRGTCRHGDGDGCVMNAAHLLGMEARGMDNCAEARETWADDDSFALDAFVYAVTERDVDFDFNDPPFRVMRAAAEEVGLDVDTDDKGDFARAMDGARRVLRERGVPIAEYDPDD